METGYIKLWRKLQTSKLWTQEKFTRGQAWVDLLMLANHKTGWLLIRGNEVEVKRGQVGWSEKKLAVRWLWSRTKVRQFLKVLKQDNRIDTRKSSVTSLISIINYEDYQENKQQKEHQKDIRKTSEDTLTINDKNVKNEKNKEKGSLSLPVFISESLFKDFLEHRKKLRKPMTEKAKEIFVKKVVNLHSKGFDPTELIETAIERGWQTVFEPREQKDGLDEFLRRHEATE